MEAGLWPVERKGVFSLTVQGGKNSEEKGGGLEQGSGVGGGDLRSAGERAPWMKTESLDPYPQHLLAV